MGAGLGFTLPGMAGAQVVTAQGAQQVVPDKEAGVRLAARPDAADRLTVEVMINGRGPYRFVVDTAAERSILTEDIAAELDLPRGPSVMVSGMAKRVPAATVPVKELSFGPFRRTGLNLPVLPRSSVMADGYLGLDAIDGTRVTFDFAGGALRIEESAEVTRDHSATVTHVAAKGQGGFLRILDCRVDTVTAVAFIDTGAEVSVGNVSLMNALRARNPNLFAFANVTLTGVTGGEVTGPVIPAKRIRLQNLGFRDGTLVIADVPDFAVWKTKYRPSLLIGMDYLRQFASVTLDYRSRDIRFELSAAPPSPKPDVVIEQV
ncbi:hypothetical protein ABAC460_23770 [Asticcacaulis sp. AC460]|nr:hypothetical protein ABAC460_23770 [Asticcacaulis sp. AC460]